MKKRFLAAGMIMTLVLSMAGCGGSSTSDSGSSNEEATTEAATEATTEELTQTETDILSAFGANIGSAVASDSSTEVEAAGITFNVPDTFGYEDTEDASDEQRMFYAIDGDAIGLVLFTTEDAQGVTDETLTSMKDTMVETIVASYDDGKEIDSSIDTLAGYDAIKCNSTANLSGTDATIETYMTAANDKILVVQLVTTADNDEWQQAFDEMIADAQ